MWKGRPKTISPVITSTAIYRYRVTLFSVIGTLSQCTLAHAPEGKRHEARDHVPEAEMNELFRFTRNYSDDKPWQEPTFDRLLSGENRPPGFFGVQ